MVVPAGLIYQFHRTKKGAVAAMVIGTMLMSAIGIVGNALVMIPFYSHFMPIDQILAMGAAINPVVGSVWSFAIVCVGPFNLVKGIIVSAITMVIYKRISMLIHIAARQNEAASQEHKNLRKL